jgi:ketosteroid isomerase-like protein
MPQAMQTSSPAGGKITEIITQLEQQWALAAKNNDATRVAPLLSDVFVDMDADGSMHTKAQVLERIKGDKWETNEISDIKVTLRGDLAIASGAWRGKGTRADGKLIDAHERWLDTWILNGKWQCIASASTPAKM